MSFENRMYIIQLYNELYNFIFCYKSEIAIESDTNLCLH